MQVRVPPSRLAVIVTVVIWTTASVETAKAALVTPGETVALAGTDAKALLPQVAGHDPAKAIVTTLAVEKRFNAFFRLSSPSVIAKLRESFPELPEAPTAREVFVKLRELRNKW